MTDILFVKLSEKGKTTHPRNLYVLAMKINYYLVLMKNIFKIPYLNDVFLGGKFFNDKVLE